MRVYEGIFVFPPDGTPEVLKKQDKTIENILQKFGGVITNKTEFGKKPLGYEIRKFREGYFFVFEFRMDPSKMIECRKLLTLQDDLIKFMVLVKQERSGKAASAKAAVATDKKEAVNTAANA
jgi:small subunit ribosomal protein S6